MGGGDATAALLAECMRAVPAHRPGLREAAAGPIDWERLLALARAHAVAETVHHALAAHALADLPPAPVRSALREAHEGATARNALLLAEAARLQRALSDAGIRSALLKGAALVAAHYPALGARHVADADLLVDGAGLADAVAVAASLGARLLAPSPAGAGELRAPGKRHAPTLALPSGVLVELHDRYGASGATGAATAGILDRAARVAWSGRALDVAAPTDLLAIACHHVFVSHGADRRFRPRHVADCAVLLARGASPAEAAALPGARAAVERSLDEPDRGLLVTAASDVGLRLGRLLEAVTRDPSRAHRSLLFPDRDYMAWRYGVARSSRLLPLLYLWRPLRGAWRLVSGR